MYTFQGHKNSKKYSSKQRPQGLKKNCEKQANLYTIFCQVIEEQSHQMPPGGVHLDTENDATHFRVY